MNPRKKGSSWGFMLLISGMLAVILCTSVSCNLPIALTSQDTTVDESENASGNEVENEDGNIEVVTAAIGTGGGVVDGPGDVELVVPEDAFSLPVEISISMGGVPPALPENTDIEITGPVVKVDLPPGVEANGVFELLLPFNRHASVEDDHYTVLRWAADHWTNAGGLVEGDRIRVRTNQFSTFMPARVVWALRPVSFVNDGPYDAVVMPWTYQPLDPFSGVLPPRLATASFAPGGPGLWPNPSRFLGLPFGTYTFCVEWDEETDLDGDGKVDVFHAFLEGPSTDLPLLVDENDSIQMDFAEEVRFRTDPVGKIEGRCEQSEISIASDLTVRLIPLDVRTLPSAPDTIAIAQYRTTPPPDNVTIESVDYLWESSDGEKIALYNGGDWISATCSNTNVTAVGVYFDSDENDGWARVLVDGREVWRGNIWGGVDGHYRHYLEVSGLAPGVHTIQMENMGIDGGGGDDDTAIRYFGFSSRPIQAP